MQDSRVAILISANSPHAADAEQVLRRLDLRVVVVQEGPEALEVIGDREPALVLADCTDAVPTGIDVLTDGWGGVVAAFGDPIYASQIAGVHFFPWPLEEHALRTLIRDIEAISGSGPTAPSPEIPSLVGQSEAMDRVVETLRQTAATSATILLQGESGSGKEVLAQTVHALSDRAAGPFVAVNCAAMPDGLVESTLFGHEKGAFTGATQRFVGAFERANGGTLLLDEISEMDLGLQAKLLRAVQEMAFERVGGSDLVRVNTRIVATTNQDLAQAVDEGRFREDLYYRLSVIPVLVPPLRDRREDIPLLVEHFLAQFAAQMGKSVRSVTPRALQMLMGHSWPGNVRELSHVVERAVALSTSERLDADDFIPERRGIAPWRRPRNQATNARVVAELTSYSLKDAEDVLIERALEATGGNRTRAAELLEISPRTLRNKLNGPRGA